MNNYLNLGCGRRFHPGWTNIDFTSSAPGVIAHNLLSGIPAPDGSADVIYHSHVLEHFSKGDGERFIKECRRVLKPGGILRVAVPDLERIVRGYLDAFEGASRGEAGWDHNYDWMMIELYDQTVRTTSGGEMFKYLSALSVPNEEFIVQRLGTEARIIMREGRSARVAPQGPGLVHKIFATLGDPARFRLWLARKLLGSEVSVYFLGKLRLSGEVHQWMYDSYSLGRLLRKCGFVDVVRRTGAKSYIENWPGYNLDTEPDGSTYKPDSLFLEARAG